MPGSWSLDSGCLLMRPGGTAWSSLQSRSVVDLVASLDSGGESSQEQLEPLALSHYSPGRKACLKALVPTEKKMILEKMAAGFSVLEVTLRSRSRISDFRTHRNSEHRMMQYLGAMAHRLSVG